ncbi:hypothetical protein [Bacteroides timonensis]|uniref:hypothetical protein n=1 Tax=Bacteroides timonensis TaxID=1470345 RepID=UPI0004AFEDF2|nr:hypothetical protein [Bacteroides timonensis]
MKQKQLIKLSYLITLLYMMAGCNSDPLILEQPDSTLALLMPDPETIAVRSTATESECRIDELVVLAYRGASNTPVFGKQYSGAGLNAVLLGNGTNSPKLSFTTEYVPQDGDCLYLFANPTVAIPITQEKDKIATELHGTLSETTTEDVLPISGMVASWNNAVTNVCVMKRAVAKVQVEISAVTQSGEAFEGQTVTWKPLNYNQRIYLSEQAAMTTGDYAGGYSNRFVSADMATSVYIPEYQNHNYAQGMELTDEGRFNANRCCVLLQVEGSTGKYNGYYRLDFHRDARYLDIKRNYHYIFHITKVRSNGYDTYEEALNNPPSNIEYEIVVDAAGNTSASNGQYAISATNDHCIIYGGYNGYYETKDYVVASAKAIMGTDATLNNITTNSIECNGDGCTLLSPDKLTNDNAEIKIATDLNFTGGTIAIRLGNLKKTITIERENILDAHPVVKTLKGTLSAFYTVENNLTGEIKTFDNGDGTYRLCIPENVYPTNALQVYDDLAVEVEPEFEEKGAVCYASTLESGTSGGKVTRLVINQAAPEYIGWFGGKGNLSRDIPYTYYDRRLLMESIEEETGKQFYSTDNYSEAPGNIENGLANTMATGMLTEFQAANYCYLKNDRNGNGAVDTDEPVLWYLPAHNQLMGIWICKENIQRKDDLNSGYYWGSEKAWNALEGYWTGWFSSFFHGAAAYGQMSTLYRVRCVRDIE